MTGDLASTSGRLAQKDMSLSTAANLLASLKPMLDALEEQLTDEERAARASAKRGAGDAAAAAEKPKRKPGKGGK